MIENNGRPNRLGLKGWLVGGRWGFERYLYTLHRVTGLGLLLYFVLHIFVTSTRVFAPDGRSWTAAMGMVDNWFFTLGEYLVFAAFAFHGINGIRLALVELGFAIGKPIEPVYPYRTSVDEQRPLAIGVMILAAILAVVGGFGFINK